MVPLKFASSLFGGGKGTSKSSGDWDEVKRNRDHCLCKI
jgi:hypothetical protein